MKIARDNHYVSRASLRRWSADDTHVYAYRILVSRPEVPNWKLKSIKGLACQADLYTTLSGDREADEFERWIGREYEHPGIEARDKLLEGGSLRPINWPVSTPRVLTSRDR